MREIRRRAAWGRPSPVPVAYLVVSGLVALWLAHWVWAGVVRLYFSSIVVLPAYGAGRVPDFGALFFRALGLATSLAALVLALFLAVAAALYAVLGDEAARGSRLGRLRARRPPRL